tara:strand:+ start:5293 stop:6543 length:1251 start_codon:yes stop_codon:yes gene_type:complete
MKLIYRILSDLFLVISPIIIIYRILKKKEKFNRLTERYAIPSKKRLNGKLIWFHCSSVGELLSIISLIEKLENNSKIKQILVTTTTLSSSKIFERFKFKKTIHQFFPIDNNFIVNKFIKYWRPSVLFLCESEIWPNLINNIYKRKINLILLNGRMTFRSFKKWKKIKSYSEEIFSKFNICFSQNHETFLRLKFLGAKKVINLGNLKFTTSKKIKTQLLNQKILNFFKKKIILVTGASTHDNEEDFIIKNHLYFKKQKKIKNIISIIAPRHIDRTEKIKNYIKNFSLKTHLYSSGKRIDKDVDIFIVDTYGELNKFYKISNIVFMGGSLIKHGGQNPLEASKFGCKIIHGPHIGNFTEIYRKLKKMKISDVFSNHNKGIKIIENSLYKKKLIFNNKKIIKYGENILNKTYIEIIKFV